MPTNSEVGAGTMNPNTFLRSLGPEPWSVCYPEPSVRPDDSRYGENPNRIQQHTQFQVLLKPDPGNAQQLYLQSLEALGCDVRRHDVRFVEDNWESPALGAWGLGWEVWYDGMEVTQFTYFQQVGGLPCDPPAVEITYGLERLLMALQGVDHFKDIVYSDTTGTTYGEVYLQNEMEFSSYQLDEGNVENHRRRYDTYVGEAAALIEARLPLPAYAHVLKASHAFNVLDARGAVGPTERAQLFADMRNLARGCAGLFLERREELGHPLGNASADTAPAPPEPPVTATTDAVDPRAFVIEIGTEELPPREASLAADALAASVKGVVDELNLDHGDVTSVHTPRRAACLVDRLATQTKAFTETIRGPPAAKCYDDDGAPTKAVQGFLKKNGASVDDLTIAVDPSAGKKDAGVEYVWLKRDVPATAAGPSLAAALQESVPKALANVSWKTMRWDQGEKHKSYPRPVRWVLSMHGETPLGLSLFGVTSGKTTVGARIGSEEPKLEVSSAESYADVLSSKGHVSFLVPTERRAEIRRIAEHVASTVGGRVPPTADTESLLDEVTGLVESPEGVSGEFDASFLALPRPVLEIVMKKHQRYFAVEKEDGSALLPSFVAIANQPCDPSACRTGYEKVLQARLEDALFYYEADRSTPIEEHNARLDGTVFHPRLGTLLDKCKRVQALVQPVGKLVGCSDEAIAQAEDASAYMSFDLASQVVMEFPTLAGTMASHYASAAGQSDAVATALGDAYLPKDSGVSSVVDVPSSESGHLLALCDKLDAFVGLYRVGCAPQANADPFGMRRLAYGVLALLMGPTNPALSGTTTSVPCNSADVTSLVAHVLKNLESSGDLREAEKASSEEEGKGKKKKKKVQADGTADDMVDFLNRRLYQLLADAKAAPVEAIRAVQGVRGDPRLVASTLQFLAPKLADGSLADLLGSYVRCVRIRSKNAEAVEAAGCGASGADALGAIDTSLFENDSEKELYEALSVAYEKYDKDMDLKSWIAMSSPLVDPASNFFDGTLVIADDESLRANRLKLVSALVGLADGVVDVTELTGLF